MCCEHAVLLPKMRHVGEINPSVWPFSPNVFFFFFFNRLRNAWECPANGSHSETCSCEDDEYKLSGGSYFSKVRLDLSSMRIIGKSHKHSELKLFK